MQNNFHENDVSFIFLLFSSLSFGQDYLLADDTEEKYYLSNFISSAQDKEKLGDNPILMVNDELVTLDQFKNLALHRADIYQLALISQLDPETVDRFGDKAKDGIVMILTKKPTSFDKLAKDTLFLVDGEEVSEAYLKEIDPDHIESVTVVKKPEEIKKYTDKDYRGIVSVKMKK